MNVHGLSRLSVSVHRIVCRGRPTPNVFHNIQKLVHVIDISKFSIKACAEGMVCVCVCVQTYNYVFKLVSMYFCITV